jgi:hypothetical protein
MFKSKRMGCGDMKNVYRILIGKRERGVGLDGKIILKYA